MEISGAQNSYRKNTYEPSFGFLKKPLLKEDDIKLIDAFISIPQVRTMAKKKEKLQIKINRVIKEDNKNYTLIALIDKKGNELISFIGRGFKDFDFFYADNSLYKRMTSRFNLHKKLSSAMSQRKASFDIYNRVNQNVKILNGSFFNRLVNGFYI